MVGHIRINEMDNLPLDLQKDILRKAHSLCYNWWFDELDCSKSFARQTVDIEFEEAMKYMDDPTAIAICMLRLIPEPYYEFGFHTMPISKPSKFLWIQVTLEEGQKIMEECCE